MRRLRVLTIAIVVAASLAFTAVANADPAFGPGNGEQGGNQKCHPPGLTEDVPGCK
jgi:hypothetical protein